MKKIFPIHGIFGIILLLLSEMFLFKKVDPFFSWFYCFAWWSYIFIVDAVIYRLKGNSLILSRTKEFFLMIPWSLFIWLIFEAANLSLENWYYINLPHSRAERWLGYAIAYGTVLPGMFETTELLETCIFKSTPHPLPLPLGERGRVRSGHVVLVLLGVLSLSLSVLIPEYFFPLIWVGFIFLLEPFQLPVREQISPEGSGRRQTTKNIPLAHRWTDLWFTLGILEFLGSLQMDLYGPLL